MQTFPSKNALSYDGWSSGQIIYAYASGNPLARTDLQGLADLNYFSPAERAYSYANAWSAQGVYTVAAHGNSQIVMNQAQAIRASTLAQAIKADPNYKGQAVLLGSCNTGKAAPNGDAPFAQQLANSLGAPVTAPLDLVWYGPSGLLGAADISGPPKNGNPGPWRTFFPEGK
jgi:fructose-specific component phosphotransferase system IIB-like protein